MKKIRLILITLFLFILGLNSVYAVEDISTFDTAFILVHGWGGGTEGGGGKDLRDIKNRLECYLRNNGDNYGLEYDPTIGTPKSDKKLEDYRLTGYRFFVYGYAGSKWLQSFEERAEDLRDWIKLVRYKWHYDYLRGIVENEDELPTETEIKAWMSPL